MIVPGMKKAAFVVGAKYGRGFIVCRREGAMGWSAPAPIRVEGGSVGFQIGGSEQDVILLVMNRHGVNKLLQDQFTLGGEGTLAAGPVGRDAAADTDASLRAEVLSWSRTHGLFAGASLDGTVVAHDKGETKKLYGREYGGRELIRGNVPPPPASGDLLTELNASGPVSNP